MFYSIRYGPFSDPNRKDQFEFYAKVNYRMFPEMEDEFDPADY